MYFNTSCFQSNHVLKAIDYFEQLLGKHHHSAKNWFWRIISLIFSIIFMQDCVVLSVWRSITLQINFFYLFKIISWRKLLMSLLILVLSFKLRNFFNSLYCYKIGIFNIHSFLFPQEMNIFRNKKIMKDFLFLQIELWKPTKLKVTQFYCSIYFHLGKNHSCIDSTGKNLMKLVYQIEVTRKILLPCHSMIHIR